MIVRLFVHQIEVTLRLPKELAVVAAYIKRDYSNFLAPSSFIRNKIKLFVSMKPRARLPKHFWLRTAYSQSTGWKTKTIQVKPDHHIWIRGRDPYFAVLSVKTAAEAYESLDRLLLSAIGEQLDQNQIHRLHAFSFQAGESGMIFTGACGVGKSYLAAQANWDPSARIFHDEITLIQDRKILPLPIAISVEERFKTAAWHHVTQRKNGSRKWRAPLAHPSLKATTANVLILAKRSHGTKSVLRSASFLEKLNFVFATGLGIGQMQMAEFTFRADLFWQLPGIFLARAFSAFRLITQAEVLSAEIPNHITWPIFKNWIQSSATAAEMGLATLAH